MAGAIVLTQAQALGILVERPSSEVECRMQLFPGFGACWETAIRD